MSRWRVAFGLLQLLLGMFLAWAAFDQWQGHESWGVLALTSLLMLSGAVQEWRWARRRT